MTQMDQKTTTIKPFQVHLITVLKQTKQACTTEKVWLKSFIQASHFPILLHDEYGLCLLYISDIFHALDQPG